MTLLTEGTAYDVVAGSFFNPSDWNDRPLEKFEIADHVQVEQQEQLEAPNGSGFPREDLQSLGWKNLRRFVPLGLPAAFHHRYSSRDSRMADRQQQGP